MLIMVELKSQGEGGYPGGPHAAIESLCEHKEFEKNLDSKLSP